MRGTLELLLVAFLCGCGSERETPVEVEEGERAGVRFLDVTEASGLTFEHDAGRTSHKHLPETMGHGVALFDFDEDGDLDVYLVQGGALPGLEGAEPGPVNRLYANLGDGRFEDRTQTAGAAAHDGYDEALLLDPEGYVAEGSGENIFVVRDGVIYAIGPDSR